MEYFHYTMVQHFQQTGSERVSHVCRGRLSHTRGHASPWHHDDTQGSLSTRTTFNSLQLQIRACQLRFTDTVTQFSQVVTSRWIMKAVQRPHYLPGCRTSVTPFLLPSYQHVSGSLAQETDAQCADYYCGLKHKGPTVKSQQEQRPAGKPEHRSQSV